MSQESYSTDALGVRTRRAFGWTAASNVGVRVIRLASLVVLARLIAPEHFGSMTLAIALLGALLIIVSSGFPSLTIQRQDLDHNLASSAFWYCSGLGVATALILIAAAQPLAALLGDQAFTNVIRGTAPALIFMAVTIVPQSLLIRDMRMRPLAIRSIFATSVATAVALIAALLGAGVWSLVLQTLVESAANMVGALLAARFRPSLTFSWVDVKGCLFQWGFKNTAMDLTNTVSSRADTFFIGAILGTAALGLYSVAVRLLVQLNEAVAGSARNVSFSAYSRLHHDPHRVAHAFTKVIRSMFAALALVYGFLALYAEQIISLLFGAEWSQASSAMSVLCLAGLCAIPGEGAFVLIQAQNRPGLAFALSAARMIGLVTAYFVVVPHGLTAVATANLGVTLCSSGLLLLIACRLLPIPVGELLGSLSTSLAGLCAATIASSGVIYVLDLEHPLAVMSTAVVLGTVYLLVVRLFSKSTWQVLIDLLPVRARRVPRPSARQPRVTPPKRSPSNDRRRE